MLAWILLMFWVSCALLLNKSVSCDFARVMLVLIFTIRLLASVSCPCSPVSLFWAAVRSAVVQPPLSLAQAACWMEIWELRLAICWGTVQLRFIRFCLSFLAWVIFFCRSSICFWRAAIWALQSPIWLSMPLIFWSTPRMVPWRAEMLARRPAMFWLAWLQLCVCVLSCPVMVAMTACAFLTWSLTPSWLLRAMLSCWVRPSPLVLTVLIWLLTLLRSALLLFSWLLAPSKADWIDLILFYCWVMLMLRFCWVATPALSCSVKTLMSSCACFLLAVPCLMISSRLAMVWVSCVCSQKRLVMLVSYSLNCLMGWLLMAAWAVAIWMTLVLGRELGMGPVGMLGAGQQERFWEEEMRFVLLLYWEITELRALDWAWLWSVVRVSWFTVLPLTPRFRLRLFPRLQFTPFMERVWDPLFWLGLGLLDELELEEEELDEEEEEVDEPELAPFMVMRVARFRLALFWSEAAAELPEAILPVRLTPNRMMEVSVFPLLSVAVIFTGNCPCMATSPVYTS